VHWGKNKGGGKKKSNAKTSLLKKSVKGRYETITSAAGLCTSALPYNGNPASPQKRTITADRERKKLKTRAGMGR